MKFNMNMIGLALVVIAFGYSMFHVATLSRESGEGLVGGDKIVIRLVHWQLEPGYRPAMAWAMQQYMNLPHVREAGVIVKQLAVTERVYRQFLNTHLIAGTAPDICEMGMASMTTGEFTARYFEPLNRYTEQANPYNAPRYLPSDLNEELVKVLGQSPWRDTFIDGMQGGWDHTQQSYFKVPTSFFGSAHLFYNRRLLGQAKQLLRQGIEATPQPAWLSAKLITPSNPSTGYAVDRPELRSWLDDTDAAPRTLGQLLLVCGAVRELARQMDRPRLVPIAGSKYSYNIFTGKYLVPFTARLSERMDSNHDSDVRPYEALEAWRDGVWSFDSPAVAGFYECVRVLAEQFPPGFSGLDREMASRRFKAGDAAMIATGAWDAGTLIKGARGFEVGIMDFPLPGPGERWSNLIADKANEAQSNAGAAYAINQRSKHKDWAIDFLHFLTSYPINQEFNRRANWIPCIVGTSPTREMLAFQPDQEGLLPSIKLNLKQGGSNITATHEGQFLNFLAGDISYAEFVRLVTPSLKDPRHGVDRMWHDEWVRQRDSNRNSERRVAAYSSRRLLTDEKANPATDPAFLRALQQSVLMNNGTDIRAQWVQQNPDQPFPEF